MACTSLPLAILPAGKITAQRIPARAAYAAAEADVFPVDAQIKPWAPRSTALETATVIPRSLNEPVGFKPSHLIKTRPPIRSLNRGAKTRGVEPSPRVMIGVPSPTGRQSRYRAITPLAADPPSPSFGAESTAASTAQDFFDSFCILCQRNLPKCVAKSTCSFFRLKSAYA